MSSRSSSLAKKHLLGSDVQATCMYVGVMQKKSVIEKKGDFHPKFLFLHDL
jgi:hypothetical protein